MADRAGTTTLGPTRPVGLVALAAFAILRLGWGVALLAAPARVLRLLGGEPAPASSLVVRLLGARHAVQAVAQLAVGPRSLLPGTALDAVHAASMVVLARVDSTQRIPAERDALIEAGFVGLGLGLAAALLRGARAHAQDAGGADVAGSGAGAADAEPADAAGSGDAVGADEAAEPAVLPA